MGNRRNNKFEDPYRWWGTTVSYILARVEYMGHTVNFKTCYQDDPAQDRPLSNTIYNAGYDVDRVDLAAGIVYLTRAA